jgi:hypothetical protein
MKCVTSLADYYPDLPNLDFQMRFLNHFIFTGNRRSTQIAFSRLNDKSFNSVRFKMLNSNQVPASQAANVTPTNIHNVLFFPET